MSKLALGTVQFGLPYGIANPKGQVSQDEASQILHYAWNNAIDMLDTAIAYGDSEQRLGRIGVQDWRIVSKLPRLPQQLPEIEQWVNDSILLSLEKLRIDSLYGLLLHHPDDLMGAEGKVLFQALQALKNNGVIQRIGISIYDPTQLETLCAQFDFDLVQAPLNVLDQRLLHSGWLADLAKRNVEIHVRSIFLQGLLLMEPETRPRKFDRWQNQWKTWHDWLRQNDLTPLQACLGFALAQPEISRVIVGVDSVNQLREILSATQSHLELLPDFLSTHDLDLINPTKWQAL